MTDHTETQNAEEKTELQKAWEQRQKDSHDAVRIAEHVGRAAHISLLTNFAGPLLAVASAALAVNPMMFFFAPPAILLAQTLVSRAQSNSLRKTFNRLSEEVSPGARQILRPVDILIPNHAGLNKNDVSPQKHPVRVWGGVAAFFVGRFIGFPFTGALALTATWMTAAMAREEIQSKHTLRKTAADLVDRHKSNVAFWGPQ
jgi:hypothetical protein